MTTSRLRLLCYAIIFVLALLIVAGCGSSHPVSCTPASPTPCLATMTPTAGFLVQDYNQFFEQYYWLVVHQRYEQAYAMLSDDLRQQVTFAAFRKNPQYVLFQGCWKLVKIAVSQADTATQSWVIGAELAYSSSCLPKTIIFYYWLIQEHIHVGKLYMSQLQLTPTGIQNVSHSAELQIYFVLMFSNLRTIKK